MDDEDKNISRRCKHRPQIDMNSIEFFVCILLALATLARTHMLNSLAQWLDLR